MNTYFEMFKRTSTLYLIRLYQCCQGDNNFVMQSQQEQKDCYLNHIEKMRNELLKLSVILENQQSFNSQEARLFLQQHTTYSSRSQSSTQNIQTNKCEGRLETDAVKTFGDEASEQDNSQQNISKFTHNKEEETTAFVNKHESESSCPIEIEQLPIFSNTNLQKKMNSKMREHENPSEIKNTNKNSKKDSSSKASFQNMNMKKSFSNKSLKKGTSSRKLSQQKKFLTRMNSGINFNPSITQKIEKPKSKDYLRLSIGSRGLQKLNKLKFNEQKDSIKKNVQTPNKNLKEKKHQSMTKSHYLDSLINRKRIESKKDLTISYSQRKQTKNKNSPSKSVNMKKNNNETERFSKFKQKTKKLVLRLTSEQAKKGNDNKVMDSRFKKEQKGLRATYGPKKSKGYGELQKSNSGSNIIK